MNIQKNLNIPITISSYPLGTEVSFRDRVRDCKGSWVLWSWIAC